jgi:hypothetical protein
MPLTRIDGTQVATIAEDCRTALITLGGRAHLRDIYRTVKTIRQQAGRSLTGHWQAAIRESLERKSSDSANWDRRDDWFEMGRMHGLPVGFWSLRSMTPRPPSRDYQRGYSAGWVAAMAQVRTFANEPPRLI